MWQKSMKDQTADDRNQWMPILSVPVSSHFLFCFFVSSPRPWISWASWQRRCLWRWRSYTVALTPPLLQVESMSSWCDSLMDRSSVPLFTSASASWVCCAPRRKLSVFSLSHLILWTTILLHFSLLLVILWYIRVSLISGGHWDKWRISRPAYEAGRQWRSFFCGRKWKHGGKMAIGFFILSIFSILWHFISLLSLSHHSKLLFFIPLSPRSQPTCAPPQFLLRCLRRSRRPLRDLQSLGLVPAGKNAVANACVLILTWEKRSAPHQTRERGRKSGREKVIRPGRRVLPKRSQSHRCKSGQWLKQIFFLWGELTV